MTSQYPRARARPQIEPVGDVASGGTSPTVAKGPRLGRRRPVTLRSASPVSWPRSFGRSVDREQVRSRILAFAGIWFLLAGFLWALGLSVVLLFSLVLLLVGGLLAGALWLERRYRVERAFVAGASSLERVSRRGKARLDELAPGEHLKRYANGASRRAQSFVETYQKKPEPAPEPVAVEVEVEVDRGGEAHRLNELGAQLRRDGDHDGAVEQ